jgi:hypothetical protein
VTAAELDMMLNGKPTIDIEEIRAYTVYQGSSIEFSETCEQVIWLWQVVRDFDANRRQKFLAFVTGTSRLPLDGYSPPFNVTEGCDMVVDSLPKSHTCFNQLVIPHYSSVGIMRARILFAIEETGTFDLT